MILGFLPSPKDLRAGFRGAGLAYRTVKHAQVGRRVPRMRFRAMRRLLWKGFDVPRRDQYFAARTRLLAARQARRTRKALQAEIASLKQQMVAATPKTRPRAARKSTQTQKLFTLGGTGLVGFGGGRYVERERHR